MLLLPCCCCTILLVLFLLVMLPLAHGLNFGQSSSHTFHFTPNNIRLWMVQLKLDH